MPVTADEIQSVRYELADSDPSFPLMSDQEITYYLEKHSNSIRRASLDCARAALFKLSMRSDETVDIFSLRGTGAARNYMQALTMYIKDPNLNPVYNNIGIYAGGVSKSDMLENDSNADNNLIVSPSEDPPAGVNVEDPYFGI